MKKIVALVLSLVMVLGLATTAFAGTADMNGVAGATTGLALGYDVEVKAAAPAVDTAKMFATYQLYFTNKETKAVSVEGPFAEVAVADQATWTFVDGTTVRYFAAVANYDVVVKAVEVEYKTVYACGDIKAPGTTDVTYYYDAVKDQYYVADAAGQVVGNVNGMAIKLSTTTVTKETHDFDYDEKAVAGNKVAITNVYCTACKANFAFVDGTETDAVKKFGAGNYAPAFTGREGTVYIALGAVAAPEAGDKVESAETFDAGIAMYVGMSVMAAAGSAVVLKKKD